MKFYKAMIALIVMATILGIGMVKMSNGHPALLIFGLVVFVISFARIGCLSH